jgi:hypothetical protein
MNNSQMKKILMSRLSRDLGILEFVVIKIGNIDEEWRMHII